MSKLSNDTSNTIFLATVLLIIFLSYLVESGEITKLAAHFMHWLHSTQLLK